ncbi:MAG TPA: prepilin-type N-terminal cleavage/methylation domain-containing protein [Candidatus Saccharimonadales bacterium]|jgi:prepilin-type N-terminal cleavage/methylation domain-containing protein|nr:prepilin-type N-terminal cleavage/methylation domain-containing protein [Candidatus Saccharimonadales bacterium]
MNSGNQPHGFTIVEVLIVLALASFLFVAVVAAMNGDQNQTEFDTGARQIYSQLQSLSSDVQNGNYPVENISCTSLGSNGKPTFSTQIQTPAGTNFSCVYVGKAIQFNPSSTSAYYYVYSLVGDQFSNNSDLNLPPAFPNDSATVLGYGGLPVNYPPLGTQIIDLPDHFVISKISYSGNPNDSNFVIGFYNAQTAKFINNSSLGNQLFIIPLIPFASSQTAVSDLSNDKVGTTDNDYNIDPSSTVDVCFSSSLEPKQVVNISFENQSNSNNLVLSYGTIC